MVAGLKTFLIPTEADFHMLEKSNVKPKTNMKGEPRKNDKQKSKNGRVQMPLRSHFIDFEFLHKVVQEFYDTSEAILFMFLATLIQVTVITLLTLVPYEPL